MDEKITNKKKENMQLAKRRLTFIGRVRQMQNDRIPARLLFFFYYKKIRVGRPSNSTRH